MALLTDDELAAALAGLPGWSGTGEAIARTVQAETFLAAIALVGRVAEAAERADHHPDIDIRWRTVHLALTTHDAGGLTELDFALAAQIEEIAR